MLIFPTTVVKTLCTHLRCNGMSLVTPAVTAALKASPSCSGSFGTQVATENKKRVKIADLTSEDNFIFPGVHLKSINKYK